MIEQTRFFPAPRADGQTHDSAVARSIVGRICGDLGRMCALGFQLLDVRAERGAGGVAGEHVIHIAFKLDVDFGHARAQGCLLVPLPDAITLASALLVLPQSVIETRRGDEELDLSTKDAMLEVGNLIGGSVGTALRKHYGEHMRARSAGCRGVKPGLVPSFAHAGELLVARASARIAVFPPFEMLLMLPQPSPG